MSVGGQSGDGHQRRPVPRDPVIVGSLRLPGMLRSATTPELSLVRRQSNDAASCYCVWARTPSMDIRFGTRPPAAGPTSPARPDSRGSGGECDGREATAQAEPLDATRLRCRGTPRRRGHRVDARLSPTGRAKSSPGQNAAFGTHCLMSTKRPLARRSARALPTSLSVLPVVGPPGLSAARRMRASSQAPIGRLRPDSRRRSRWRAGPVRCVRGQTA